MSDLSFDEALAMVRANQGDLSILFRVLGEGLATSLPAQTTRTYAGRFGKRATELVSVAVDLGERGFALTRRGDNLVASTSLTSRGVRLSSTTVTMDEWVAALQRELALQAAQSETARLALEHLVLGGD